MPGYRRCITENAADRQRQFESALLELMGAKLLPQISIQEVCDRVGLSRKSFYRYFSSREDCLNALVDHAILGFTDLPVQGDQMQTLLEQFFLYWTQRKPLLDVLYRNGRSDLLFERAMHCAVQEYGVRNYFREENGSYDRTVFFVSGLFGVLLNWYISGCQKSPTQLAAVLSDFLPKYTQGVFER